MKTYAHRYWQPLASTLLLLCFSHATADDFLPEADIHAAAPAVRSEIGIGVGVMVFLGPDFRFFYRKSDSPWLFGIRYLNIEDDFINESAVGLPGDSSDKMLTERYGIYFDYLFNTQADAGSFYVSSALYQVTQTLRCNGESDGDSATSPYFGGGYRGSFGEHFGYNAGLLFTPFVSLSQSTSLCSNSSNGDFDFNFELVVKF